MSRFAAESWAQFLRWWWQLKRRPAFLIMSLSQPLMWLLMFAPAMRSRVQPADGVDYLAFVLPGVVAFTLFGSSLMAGIPILFDKETGFLTRLMASPAARGSILVGRGLYTVLLSLAQALLILAVGWAMGAKLALGVLSTAYLLLVAALLSLGLTVVSLGLAFKLKHHSTFFILTGTLGMPVLFLSNALFEIGGMPAWMGFCASLNPMTYAIDGMRAAAVQGNLSGALPVLASLALFNALAFFWGVRIARRALG